MVRATRCYVAFLVALAAAARLGLVTADSCLDAGLVALSALLLWEASA